MTRILAAVLVCFVVALPAVVLAKPKVALAPLDGDSSGDVGDAISDALDGGELTIVGPKQFTRALDKLGLDAGDLSDKDLKKLATELDADAVIQAKLTAKGGNKVLRFKLFAHGKKQKGFKVEFASAKSTKFKQMLHDKMLEKLGIDKAKASADDDADTTTKAEPKSAKTKKKKGADKDKDADADDADAKPAKGKKKGGDKDKDADAPVADDTDARPKKKAAADSDDDDKKPAADRDDADEKAIKPKKVAAAADDDGGGTEVHASVDVGAARAPAHSANSAAVRIDAGMSVVERRLSFTSKVGLANPPTGYKNNAVPGARVEGAIYPLELAGSSSAVLSGIGIDFLYDKVFSLNLTNETQAPGVKFPVDDYRYEIGPRFRYLFGSSPTSPSLSVGVDYGHRTFIVQNRGALPVGSMLGVPDVDYRGFTPNFELRVPIVPAVAMFVSGGSLLARGTGAIQSVSQYGRAKVTEGEAAVGFDVVFAKRFALRVEGEFAQVGFAFTGNGVLSNDLDGDPSTPDVGGATDRYIGGAATLAVMY
ncbi:MAG TPA: hypothetical protein VMJ10_20410 [Kofleriaceae bacterium]|nr:hypothetical protein [Kofleriaceae bacterium]